jgi:hypothetical protein
MPHIIRKPGILGGTTLAVFMTLVHTVNDAMTAILGALLPTLQVHHRLDGMLVSGSYGQRTTLAQQAATHTPFFPLRFTDIKAASARSNSSSAVVPSSPVATPIERVIAPIP